MGKKLYEARKAAGLCVRCGENPPRPGHMYCAECTQRRRGEWRDAYMYYVNNGICVGCRKAKAMAGYIHCAACREKIRDRARQRRERDPEAARAYIREYMRRYRMKEQLQGEEDTHDRF